VGLEPGPRGAEVDHAGVDLDPRDVEADSAVPEVGPRSREAGLIGAGGAKAGSVADEAGPAAGDEADSTARGNAAGRWWRGFTGSVAAGLAVVAVLVLVVGVLCFVNGAAGPGLGKLVGHPVAAVVALGLQRVADRRFGRVAAAAGGGVLVVAAVAFTLLWWV
jgi:hypothetical protein